MKFNLLLLITFSLCIISSLKAQDIAVTERGDSVVLYNNGLWDYYENYINNKEAMLEIKTNDKSFVKPSVASNKAIGKNDAYSVYFNPKKWKKVPVGDLNPDADLAFQLIDGDAYAMVIFEEVEIQMENLSQIALENAVGAAPDIKMIDREYRNVNDNKVVWMRMDGTTQGMKISYYSYYHSGENGSIQFHTFTGQSLLKKYQDELDELLNGLTIKK